MSHFGLLPAPGRSAGLRGIKSRSRVFRNIRAAFIIGLFFFAIACSDGRGGLQTGATDVPLVARVAAISDIQMTVLDHGAPSYGFDGLGGSLLLGDGWEKDEFWGGESFAWIAGTTATLWFGQLDADEPMEFRASCRALAFEGAPEQELTVSVNGEIVGTAIFGRRWEDLHFRIPGAVLTPGLNRVLLDLAWSRKPAEVGINNDNRDLSAAFRWIAVIEASRAVDDPLSDRNATMDRESGLLTLNPDAVLAIPVPPKSRLTLRLEAHPAAPPSGRLKVNVARPNAGWEEVWRGPLVNGVETVVVENTDHRPLLLQVAADDSGDRRPGGESPISLVWRPDHFEIEAMAEPQSASRPHVFLYVVDTVRVDSLALYGSTRPTSPALEEFSRDAVMYRNVITASTWTLPSVVSILTGVFPFRHGVMQGNVKLSAETPYPTLATLLGDAGYDTVGISQSFVAGPQFGVDTGFRRFLFNNQLNGRLLRTGRIRRALTEWLLYEHDWKSPILAYVHTVGPHAPYQPTGGFRGFADSTPGELAESEYRPSRFVTEGYGGDANELAHLRALYDGEIQYADHEFGRFLEMLKFLGLYDDSVIIFMSDHGEEFADHGGFDHGRTVHQEVARVPLLVKYPLQKGATGLIVDERVSTVDVFATIAAVTGFGIDHLVVDGKALPLDTSHTEAAQETADHRLIPTELDVVANEIYRAVNYRGLWAGSTECIENLTGFDRFGKPEPKLRVFDLAADPNEIASLPDNDPRYDLCRDWLAGWARVIEGGALEAGAGIQSSEETLDMLRALGYIK